MIIQPRNVSAEHKISTITTVLEKHVIHEVNKQNLATRINETTNAAQLSNPYMLCDQ